MRSSIVIRAKNEARHIGETLTAVFQQEDVGPFEVILVDSGSTDGTVGTVRQFPVELIEIPPETFTYGRALNVGIGRASGEAIVSLSAHTLPIGPHWLRDLLGPFKNPRVAGVYGRQVPRENASLLEILGMRMTGIMSQNPRLHSSSPMFSNANGAIRRSLWLEEPFDEEVAGAEDLAWVRVMLSRGYLVAYEPTAAAYHSHGEPLLKHLRRIGRDLPTVAGSVLGLPERRQPGKARASIFPQRG